MTRDTQLAWTKKQLTEKGYVTRNQALRRYYSRLGARILDLRRAGWKITGYWKPTKQGRDYVYQLEV